MKKALTSTLAALMSLSLVACGSSSDEATATATTEAEASASAETMVAANYTIYNGTGATVTELYIYEVDSEDKGTNYAEDGLAAGESVVVDLGELTETEAADYTFTLEFTNEEGYSGTFETLSWEEVPITLLAADDMTGATPISFSALSE